MLTIMELFVGLGTKLNENACNGSLQKNHSEYWITTLIFIKTTVSPLFLSLFSFIFLRLILASKCKKGVFRFLEVFREACKLHLSSFLKVVHCCWWNWNLWIQCIYHPCYSIQAGFSVKCVIYEKWFLQNT